MKFNTYTYEDSKMKPTKHGWKRGKKGEEVWEYNGEVNIQSTLYPSMELSQ
jgi:hypothetical protein